VHVVGEQPLGARLVHGGEVGEQIDGQLLARRALVAPLRHLDEVAHGVEVEQRLASLALQLQGQRRRHALQRPLGDLLGGLDAHVEANPAGRRPVGGVGAAQGDGDHVDVGAAADVAAALRQPGGERVQVEAVAQQALALQLPEARVRRVDAPGEQIGELALAEEGPVAGVGGHQHATGDAPPAEEPQRLRRQLRRYQGEAARRHPSPSSSAAFRRREMVSNNTWLAKAWATVARSCSGASEITATTASAPGSRAMAA
jgi:hypothetical protein